MTGGRWAVLGLAPARTPWFGQVTGWAMSGLVPLDFEAAGVAESGHETPQHESALTALRSHLHGRLVCVFGCGGDRDASKRPELYDNFDARAIAMR